MAAPTPPSGSLTWTTIPSAGVGPALSYASATSSMQTTIFYTVGGPILAVGSGAVPDVASMVWTSNAAASGAYPTLSYAPICAATPHGLYLLPGGVLVYE